MLTHWLTRTSAVDGTRDRHKKLLLCTNTCPHEPKTNKTSIARRLVISMTSPSAGPRRIQLVATLTRCYKNADICKYVLSDTNERQ